MGDYRKEYYEQKVFWNYDYLKNIAERERIQEVINVIPSDVQSILDVGCGNGTFVNLLINAFPDRFDKVVGLDASKEALKYVKTEKVNGTITNLLFEEKSFDLVTCLETLEHLPQEDFKKGILELQRVSKRHIIITVPNEEDLEHSLVMCPKCHCWFNPYFHMRSFNKKTLRNLFNNFNSIKVKEIGPAREYRSYNPLLSTLYRTRRKPLPPVTSICPQCGCQHKESPQDIKNVNSSCFALKLLSLLKPLAKVIWLPKEKKRWLLALYLRKGRILSSGRTSYCQE